MSFSAAFQNRARSLRWQYKSIERPAKLYAAEGLIIAFVVNMLNNNNYLFATRMGAGDIQLGLVSMLPQLVNMLVLIPGAVLTDSLKSKRWMVIFSIGLTGFLYLTIGFVPLFESVRLPAFIGLLALSSGTLTLYSLSWQSFFTEVIPSRKRNATLTLRTYASVLMGVLTPLITGNILSRLGGNEQKIMAHQGFFIAGALLLVLQISVLRRLKPVSPAHPQNFRFSELKKACVSLLHNKPFLIYAGVAWFFYLTWQMDWTMYFIGQTVYLKMNEAQLGIVIVCATLTQFLTLRIWSRVNDRKSVDYTLTFGLFGLCLCPLSMIAASSLPAPINIPSFIIFNTISNLASVTLQLNPFQCLLKVLDDKYKTISISLFTVLTCLSNAVMPFTGVMLYRALGGDLNALHGMFGIEFVLRVCAGLIWMLRLRYIGRQAQTAA